MRTHGGSRLTPDLPPLVEVPDLRMPGSEGHNGGDASQDGGTEADEGDGGPGGTGERHADGDPVPEQPD